MIYKQAEKKREKQAKTKATKKVKNNQKIMKNKKRKHGLCAFGFACFCFLFWFLFWAVLILRFFAFFCFFLI